MVRICYYGGRDQESEVYIVGEFNDWEPQKM